jgi:hypothetical protein
MKLPVLVALGLAVASFSSPARAGLTTAQRVELREKLVSLANAFQEGDASKAINATMALERWGLDNEPALPLNWLCQRARDLAKDGLDPASQPVAQFIAAVRRMGDDCADAGVPSYDASAARRTLEEVLSAPEYQVRTTDSVGWWRRAAVRFLVWLNDMLNKLMSTEPAQRIANIAYYLALALLLVPLLWLAGYLVWRQSQSREPSPVLESARQTAPLDSPDVHLARGGELLQRGEFMEALKQYHLAVLAHLEQRGIVAHDRARTNWEYFAQVQRKTDSARPLALLRNLNLVYDKAVFGVEPCNAGLVEAFSLTVGEFLRAMDQLPAPPGSR